MINIEAKKAVLAEQLKRWDVPSCALAIVKDGEVLFAGGVGMRDNAAAPVTENTLFQIASCTKAFTATLAAVCATEGLLDFDTPVREYMPDFRLSDDYATAHLTVRDFLSHRSGLPRHEMAWYGTGFSRRELMANLRHLPLNMPIRYQYQYSNFNYLITGALIEAVTGMKFEDALREKLLLPLGMERSFVYLDEIEHDADHALAFGRPEEYTMTGIVQIPYYSSPAEVRSADPGEKVGDPTAAAGCIVSCARDMAKWLQFNLSRGKVGERQLVREDLMDLIATMHIYSGDDPAIPEQSGGSYGLGWSVFNYRGHKMLEHGGNLNGFTSSTSFVPDRNLGLFISANMNVTLLPEALFRDLIDADLGVDGGNWYERMYRSNEAMFQYVLDFFRAFGGECIPDTRPSHKPEEYAGTYEADGYRRFLVLCEDGKLVADFNTFRAELKHHHYDSFATTASFGELPAGLVLTFGTDPEGTVRTLSVTLGSERNLKPIVFTRKANEP